MTTLRRVPALLALPLAAGCYTYAPLEPGGIPAGAEVRARLAPAEATRLGEWLAEPARTVEGRVVEVGADSVLMEVTVVNELRGDRMRTLSQRIHVARTGILDVEERRMDRGRTALVAGGVGLLAGALLAKQLSGSGEGDDPPNPPPPGEIRIPLLRIPLGF